MVERGRVPRHPLTDESKELCGNMMKRRILLRSWTFASAVALLVLASISDGVSEEVRYQWRRTEFVFTTTGRYQRPWEDVELSVQFAGPDHESFRVNGYWDGGNTWKVRFVPTRPGRWSYRVDGNAADAGLAGQTGSFTVAPAAGDNPLDRHGGILQVSSDRHYLTYSDGTPFFWLGDTWWLCPGDQVPIDTSTRPDCPSMFKTLIDKRRQQGFTVVHMAFLGKGWTPRLDALIASRHQPDWNVDFWRTVDRYFDYANDAGLVPVVAMTWQIEKHSLEDWKFIWRYFVARYGAHSVTWLVCGEYNLDQPGQAERIARVLALGAFIKGCDPYKRAMTVHPWWHGGDKHQAWNEPWYDFIMLQGGHPGHGSVPPASIYRDAWAHGKPVIEGECNYEGIYGGLAGREVTAADVRHTAWQAVLAGACGYTYGVQGLWLPIENAGEKIGPWGTSAPWWEALQRPGAGQLSHLRNFCESVKWWKLKPCPETIVTQDGAKRENRPLARSDGDRLYVVWFPQGSGAKSPASLRIAGVKDASFLGTWFNPRTGESRPLATELSAGNGVCPLPARPDEEDWVLRMECHEKRLP
jgi:hypothetical protein